MMKSLNYGILPWHFSDPLASGPNRPTRQGIRKMPCRLDVCLDVCLFRACNSSVDVIISLDQFT